MQLYELLYKYKNNTSLNSNILMLKHMDKNSIVINKRNDEYVVLSTGAFERSVGSTSISVTIDSNYHYVESVCSCLEHYRKKECVHAALLFMKALSIIDKEYYLRQVRRFESIKLAESHNEIMNNLALNITSVNPYFGAIHLTPVIEYIGGAYRLSIRIKQDKEYVVKELKEFIYAMENGKEIEYGQKLSFVHSYECLDDLSKEFYSFLANIAYKEESKYIEIRKSQLLKVLEIYQESYVYYGTDDAKQTLRLVTKTLDTRVVLNAQRLSIHSPLESKKMVCGVNHAYFIDEDKIYYYTYKSRLERKIYESLFKVDKGLIIDVNSDNFIGKLLPIIKNNIIVENDFFDKYPIPKIKVDSYITYSKSNIYLRYEILCNKEERNSPYIQQLLETYFQAIEGYYFAKNKDGIYNICNIDNQYRFLTSDISPLKSFGDVYFDESFKSIKPKKSSRTRISVSYNVGLLDFRFENSTLTIEEIQAMLKAYHEKKSFVKLNDDTIIEIDESDAKQIDDFLEDFNIDIDDLTGTSKPLNYILKIVEAKDDGLSYDKEVNKIISTIQNFKHSAYEPTEPFKPLLREYQLEGYKWLKTLSSFGFGGILADDMGLGKTLQIISFIEEDKANKPSIIVCPTSLVYNWENECQKWPTTFKTKLIIGAYENRFDMITSINENEKCLYITSYDSLRRDIELYKSKFRFVIADEAQFIKNQNALKSEAIKSLKSEINYALTGTPIENGLSDLWSIFDYLMPGYLSNYSRFKVRYESLIVHQDKEALKLLKLRVSPFILRRTKKDVLDELPDKIEEYYYCKMGDKQHDVYNVYVHKVKEDLVNGGKNVLALLTRLRQICITPQLIFEEEFENTKIDMAIDLIKSSISGNHRILLFSQFTQSFSIISKRLEAEGISHLILDGATKSKTRMEMVDAFNHDTSIKVFVISLKAGGTGLNLVGADMVIHLDPWWNSSAETQATDRAHRIGQTKNVYVAKLICKDTIEEKVVKLQEVKRELANSIISSDEDQIVKLTNEDILNLLN